jgi:Ca-activated chloride channel family protein
MKRKLLIFALSVVLPVCAFCQQDYSTKKERNYIREGNELFKEKRYAEAEAAFKKALQENGNSPIAKFNLATTYLKQVNLNDTTQNGLLSETQQLLKETASIADPKLASKAYYDLGNIFYNQKNYAQSIAMYKDALRRNPDDDQARQNLRLAQKQLQNQQNQQQNQDNKQDNKDQQKQNQDQNKEKNKNGQDQQKPDNQQQKQPQQPPKNGMSKENAEQILQTMQNEEKNTQDKVNKAKMQQMKGGRRTGKQW